MQGPRVLLSYYVTRVISCSTRSLSSFVTLPGLPLWFFRTCLGLRGAPPDIQSAFFCFGIRSSSWPLPRQGALGFSMLCPFLALFPRAGLVCPLLSSQVLWRRLRPLPCSSVCGLPCTGPTNTRQSQWETVTVYTRVSSDLGYHVTLKILASKHLSYITSIMQVAFSRDLIRLY